MTIKNSTQFITHFDVSDAKSQRKEWRCAALSFIACL